jgi:hypothetical protein
MANQRGGAANAGLIARQAAQQGAQTQQNAVGQSATLQAQQQLAAQQGAAALQGQIGNQVSNEQAANNQLFGTSVGANNTQNANLISNYGMAQGLNQSTAQSNANATNQTTGSLLSAVGNVAALAQGGEVQPQPPQPPTDASGISSGFNSATGSQGISNSIKNVKNYASGGPVSFAGQFLNSSPSMQAEFGAQNTGQVAGAYQPPAATGTGVKITMPGKKTNKPTDQSAPVGTDQSAPVEGSAQTVSGVSDTPGAYASAGDQGEGAAAQPDPTQATSGMGDAPSVMAAKGGKVPAMVSPGEKYLPPQDVKKVKEGKANPMQVGETIKGKAKVKGDSLKNDTVPKTLESGGIVLPRHITQA